MAELVLIRLGDTHMHTFINEYGLITLSIIAFSMAVVIFAWLQKSYNSFELNFIATITGTTPSAVLDAKGALDKMRDDGVDLSATTDVNDTWD